MDNLQYKGFDNLEYKGFDLFPAVTGHQVSQTKVDKVKEQIALPKEKAEVLPTAKKTYLGFPLMTWGIIAAIGVGGYFLFFRKK